MISPLPARSVFYICWDSPLSERDMFHKGKCDSAASGAGSHRLRILSLMGSGDYQIWDEAVRVPLKKEGWKKQ